MIGVISPPSGVILTITYLFITLLTKSHEPSSTSTPNPKHANGKAEDARVQPRVVHSEVLA